MVKYPGSRMYWPSEVGLCLDVIADAMPVNRFKEILRHIHFVVDYSLEAGNVDKLFKIQPVLNALEKTFHSFHTFCFIVINTVYFWLKTKTHVVHSSGHMKISLKYLN